MKKKIYFVYTKDRTDGIEWLVIAESKDEVLDILNKDIDDSYEDLWDWDGLVIDSTRNLDSGEVLFHCADSLSCHDN
jgi:hypothetical protein